MRVTHCAGSSATTRAPAASTTSRAGLDAPGGRAARDGCRGRLRGPGRRSQTATELANRCGSAAGVPASAPVQAPKLWPHRIRSTCRAHGAATPSRRSARVAIPSPSGHHSTPSCRRTTTHRAPSRRSASASAATRSATSGTVAGTLREAISTRMGEADDAHRPGVHGHAAAQGSSPTSTFAHRTGNPSRATAARIASTPSSNSWLPTVAAAIGRSATSSHGCRPRTGNDGWPTTKSPTSSQIAGMRSRSRSSSATTPAHVPLSPCVARRGSVAAPRSLVERTRSAVPGSGGGSTSMVDPVACCGDCRGVSDGTRTRGHRDHNPELYQLSYAHHGRQAPI